MAKAPFQLTTQVLLSGPTASNINRVRADIQKALNNIPFNINLQVSSNSAAVLTQINAALSGTQTQLKNTSSAASSATTSVNNLTSSNKKAASAVQQNTKAQVEYNNAMQHFGHLSALALKRNSAFLLVATSVFGFIRATISAFSEAVKFDKEMVRLSQIMRGTNADVKAIGDSITNVAKMWGVSSMELVKSTDTLAQAGYTASQVKILMEALAKTTLAPTFGDLTRTTEGLIAVMQQFGTPISQAEAALGSINQVAAKFAVESEDLIEAVKRSGGVFAAAKGNFHEFLGLFTSVRQTTRESAESIATGLRTIFTRMQRPTTIAMLRDLGIELEKIDEKGNKVFVGNWEAVKRLNEGLKGVQSNTALYAKVLEEVGGYRQLSKLVPLIQQFSIAERARQAALEGTTSLDKDVAESQRALSVQFAKVREEFMALIRTISNDEVFRYMVKLLTSAARAAIQLADSMKALLPLFGAIGVIKLGQGLVQFNRSFMPTLMARKAGGGLIPGIGDTDTVPAMLTPGEYVIRKSAVNRIGIGNLERMNKFAAGGLVTSSRHNYGFLDLFKRKKKGLRSIEDIQEHIGSYLSGLGVEARPSVEALEDSEFLKHAGATNVDKDAYDKIHGIYKSGKIMVPASKMKAGTLDPSLMLHESRHFVDETFGLSKRQIGLDIHANAAKYFADRPVTSAYAARDPREILAYGADPNDINAHSQFKAMIQQAKRDMASKGTGVVGIPSHPSSNVGPTSMQDLSKLKPNQFGEYMFTSGVPKVPLAPQDVLSNDAVVRTKMADDAKKLHNAKLMEQQRRRQRRQNSIFNPHWRTGVFNPNPAFNVSDITPSWSGYETTLEPQSAVEAAKTERSRRRLARSGSKFALPPSDTPYLTRRQQFLANQGNIPQIGDKGLDNLYRQYGTDIAGNPFTPQQSVYSDAKASEWIPSPQKPRSRSWGKFGKWTNRMQTRLRGIPDWFMGNQSEWSGVFGGKGGGGGGVVATGGGGMSGGGGGMPHIGPDGEPIKPLTPAQRRAERFSKIGKYGMMAGVGTMLASSALMNNESPGMQAAGSAMGTFGTAAMMSGGNPYALAAGAVLALTQGIITYTDKIKEQAKQVQQAKISESLQKVSKAIEEMTTTGKLGAGGAQVINEAGSNMRDYIDKYATDQSVRDTGFNRSLKGGASALTKMFNLSSMLPQEELNNLNLSGGVRNYAYRMTTGDFFDTKKVSQDILDEEERGKIAEVEKVREQQEKSGLVKFVEDDIRRRMVTGEVKQFGDIANIQEGGRNIGKDYMEILKTKFLTAKEQVSGAQITEKGMKWYDTTKTTDILSKSIVKARNEFGIFTSYLTDFTNVMNYAQASVKKYDIQLEALSNSMSGQNRTSSINAWGSAALANIDLNPNAAISAMGQFKGAYGGTVNSKLGAGAIDRSMGYIQQSMYLEKILPNIIEQYVTDSSGAADAAGLVNNLQQGIMKQMSGKFGSGVNTELISLVSNNISESTNKRNSTVADLAKTDPFDIAKTAIRDVTQQTKDNLIQLYKVMEDTAKNLAEIVKVGEDLKNRAIASAQQDISTKTGFISRNASYMAGFGVRDTSGQAISKGFMQRQGLLLGNANMGAAATDPTFINNRLQQLNAQISMQRGVVDQTLYSGSATAGAEVTKLQKLESELARTEQALSNLRGETDDLTAAQKKLSELERMREAGFDAKIEMLTASPGERMKMERERTALNSYVSGQSGNLESMSLRDRKLVVGGWRRFAQTEAGGSGRTYDEMFRQRATQTGTLRMSASELSARQNVMRLQDRNVLAGGLSTQNLNNAATQYGQTVQARQAAYGQTVDAGIQQKLNEQKAIKDQLDAMSNAASTFNQQATAGANNITLAANNLNNTLANFNTNVAPVLNTLATAGPLTLTATHTVNGSVDIPEQIRNDIASRVVAQLKLNTPNTQNSDLSPSQRPRGNA